MYTHAHTHHKYKQNSTACTGTQTHASRTQTNTHKSHKRRNITTHKLIKMPTSYLVRQALVDAQFYKEKMREHDEDTAERDEKRRKIERKLVELEAKLLNNTHAKNPSTTPSGTTQHNPQQIEKTVDTQLQKQQQQQLTLLREVRELEAETEYTKAREEYMVCCRRKCCPVKRDMGLEALGLLLDRKIPAKVSTLTLAHAHTHTSTQLHDNIHHTRTPRAHVHCKPNSNTINYQTPNIRSIVTVPMTSSPQQEFAKNFPSILRSITVCLGFLFIYRISLSLSFSFSFLSFFSKHCVLSPHSIFAVPFVRYLVYIKNLVILLMYCYLKRFSLFVEKLNFIVVCVFV